jgi:hypothetical protein
MPQLTAKHACQDKVSWAGLTSSESQRVQMALDGVTNVPLGAALSAVFSAGKVVLDLWKLIRNELSDEIRSWDRFVRSKQYLHDKTARIDSLRTARLVCLLFRA